MEIQQGAGVAPKAKECSSILVSFVRSFVKLVVECCASLCNKRKQIQERGGPSCTCSRRTARNEVHEDHAVILNGMV